MYEERSASVRFDASQTSKNFKAMSFSKTSLKSQGGTLTRSKTFIPTTQVKSLSFSSAAAVIFGIESEDDRRSLIYERSVSMQLQQMEDMEKKFEEREAYREERRLAITEKKKEDIARHRVEQWLTAYFTIVPCWAFHQLTQMSRAHNVLRTLFLPVWHRHRSLVALHRLRAQRSAELCSRMGKPSSYIFLHRPLFDMWPRAALHRLASSLHPVQYNAGEYVMFDGDPGDQMYFIVTGKVDIIICKKGPCKSKARANGSVVATLGEGAHFGEFAMLNDEPRMASAQCNEPTICWALNKKTFHEELQSIPPNDPMRVRMTDSIVKRRRDNMRKLYPLTVKQLAQLPIFSSWSSETLEPIVSAVEPEVIPASNIIFQEGSNASCVYFIVYGEVQLWKKTVRWQQLIATKVLTGTPNKIDGKVWDAELGELMATLRRGDIFGEMGVVILEPHPYTVKAVTITDLWQLPRHKFREILLSDAASFLRAKSLLCKKHAEWMDPVPLETLGKCPALCELLGDVSSRTLEAVQGFLVPQVISMGETFTTNGFLFVTHGVVESHLHHVKVLAGMNIGGEQLLTNPNPPVDTIRAVTPAEVWILPVDQVAQLKRLSTSPTGVSVPWDRSKFAQASLFMDYRLQRTLIVVSACVRLQLLGRKVRTHPTARSRLNVNRPKALQTERESSGLIRIASDDSYLSPAMMRLMPGGSPVKLRGLLNSRILSSPSSASEQEGDSITKSPSLTIDLKKEKPFAAKRTAHAIKFAAGFMPPGFASHLSAGLGTMKSTQPSAGIRSPNNSSPKSGSPQGSPKRTASFHNHVVIGRPKFDRPSSCSPTASASSHSAHRLHSP